MATHSSVLAWRIPGTGEPGGLPSMGSHSRTRLKRLSSSSGSSSKVVLIQSNLCISQGALWGGRMSPKQKSENLVLVLEIPFIIDVQNTKITQ